MKGFQDGWSTASRGVRGKMPAWRGRQGQFRHSLGNPIKELGLTLTAVWGGSRHWGLLDSCKGACSASRKTVRDKGEFSFLEWERLEFTYIPKGGGGKNGEKLPEERTQNYMWRVPLEQGIGPGLGKTMLQPDGLLSDVGFIYLWKLRGLVLVFRVHK